MITNERQHTTTHSRADDVRDLTVQQMVLHPIEMWLTLEI